MIIQALKKLYSRDLIKLSREIELYGDHTTLWKIDNSIKNTGGNLCLHIVGNLNTYIGGGLANIEYTRDREYEFAAKNIDKKILLQQIEDAIQTVEIGLSNITDQNLTDDFPIVIWESKTKMAYTLLHLYSHLNYHLGQINYHRRFFDLSKTKL